MKLLISAPCRAPRFEGIQLKAAADRVGLAVDLFDASASRDPTLELVAVVARLRPDVVLLVSPLREEPATVELLRELGAKVAVWAHPPAAGAARHLAARVRWIAAAADRTLATVGELAAVVRDRCARPASVLLPSFDAVCLGGAVVARDPAVAGGSSLVAVRAGDDPLRFVAEPGEVRLRGFGDAAAFPELRRAEPLVEPTRFAAVVSGRAYLTGGRLAQAAPSVFDDGAAAAACGARVFGIGYLGSLSSARPLERCEPAGFAEQIAQIVAWW